MKQARALARWVSGWGVAAWLAAALCLAAFVIMMFGNPPVANTQTDRPPVALWETAVSLLLLPIGIVVLLPFVAAPQFVTFWLVRRTGRILAQILLLLVSAATLVPFYQFVSTADLTSTSTASLGAVFYPIFLAAFAVPLNLVIFWISRLAERRNSRTH